MTDESLRTFHLTPVEVWERASARADYVPEPFAREGFIHCTDGEENVIAVGNRYYQGDARRYVALLIDRSRLTAPVRYEDPGRIYPHIYGPLNRDAVIDVLEVLRNPEGAFIALGRSIAD